MIGARFSLYPMRDDFVALILGGVRGLSTLGLELESDDVSTCLLGTEPALWEGLRVAFRRLAKSGAHVAMVATISAGCPGEPEGDVCVPRSYEGPVGGEEGWSKEAYEIGPVSAEVALYPLGVPDHMPVIGRAIERLKASGLDVRGEHFCTHVAGPGDDVFDTLRAVFREAMTAATHVVMTIVVSANSPSSTSRISTVLEEVVP